MLMSEHFRCSTLLLFQVGVVFYGGSVPTPMHNTQGMGYINNQDTEIETGQNYSYGKYLQI